jgi:formamidopyrimidine-DNA glycosylase
MPELPEVERARQDIERRALNRRIASVDDRDTYVSRPHAPGEMQRALRGHELVAAHRRGKTLWMETDDGGPVLGLHLGMAGAIAIDQEPSPRGWDRFTLEFDDGGRLALRDRRRLGRAVLEPRVDRLGPDAEDITRAAFRRRVGFGRTAIKARLMDQAVIAGIGNLLADEILWQARIDPRRPAGGLTEDELDRLRRTMRATLRRTISRGGAHTGAFMGAREPHGICPRCGAEVHRGTVGGRTTYWCPVEQV